MSHMVEMEGLVKRYGKTTALAGVDLVVRAGTCSACSARTGRARPRPSGSWRRCCARTAGRPGSAGTTWSASPTGYANWSG